MKKLILLLTLFYGLPKLALADSTNFSPALFVHAGLAHSSFNQNVLENKSYPYIDLEYQVSPSLSAVLHASRFRAFNKTILIPRMVVHPSKPGTISPDTLYNVEEKEKLIISCYTLKFKFKITNNKNHFAYIAPQMGFMFANSTLSKKNLQINQTFTAMESFYTYGFDLGTEHVISSDRKFRFCTGLGILIGNMDAKEAYNYTSQLDTRMVAYNVFAGLKYMLFTTSATSSAGF